MKNKRINIYITLLLIISIAGCAVNETMLATSFGNKPTPTNYVTNTFEISTPYIPEPIPTVSPSQENILSNNLLLEECTLPCYLGIITGKTTKAEAIELLSYLNIEGGIIQEDEVTRMTIGSALDIPNVIGEVNNQINDREDKNILYSNIFLLENSKVIQIRVYIQTHNIGNKYHQYFSRYSPRGIFLQIGVPDQIYISIAGGLAMIYKDEGVVLISGKYKTGNNICSSIENTEGYHHLVITDIHSSIDSFPPFENPTEDPGWIIIKDSLRIDEKTFYERVINDQSICFPIINDI
jgi:hypothetical protein